MYEGCLYYVPANRGKNFKGRKKSVGVPPPPPPRSLPHKKVMHAPPKICLCILEMSLKTLIICFFLYLWNGCSLAPTLPWQQWSRQCRIRVSRASRATSENSSATRAKKKNIYINKIKIRIRTCHVRKWKQHVHNLYCTMNYLSSAWRWRYQICR